MRWKMKNSCNLFEIQPGCDLQLKVFEMFELYIQVLDSVLNNNFLEFFHNFAQCYWVGKLKWLISERVIHV